MFVRLGVALIVGTLIPTTRCAANPEAKETPVLGAWAVGLVAIEVGPMTSSSQPAYSRCARLNDDCSPGETHCLGVRPTAAARKLDNSVCSTRCSREADCPLGPIGVGRTCQNGYCILTCSADAPCPQGMDCVSLTCLWPGE